ncbi:MAG: adenosine deaminase [Bacteroidetes bacterium]|nr:adenosine deaminase [Bacteroidota bacterium]
MLVKNHLFCFFLILVGLAGYAQDVAGWPKVELHLHLDCSLSYEVVHRLDGSVSQEDYRREFIAPPVCTDLADYIARADRAVGLMQTPEALRLVTLDLFEQLRRDGVIYAEFRFAPLKHLEKGLTGERVVAVVDSAVEEGIRKTGIQVGVILCTLRHFNKEQSMETVRLVEKFKGRHIVGFDIAGNEAGYPIDEHVAAFRYAGEHGISCTAHAGEAKGAESVVETLANFHPSRIGHGVRSIEDTALLRVLREKNILLEVCPSSNLQTNMYPDLAHHPVGRLYGAKVPLNINTDCRTISHVTLSGEYERMIGQFHWKKADFLACNLAAVDHAFTTPEVKAKLRQALRAWYAK